MVRIPAHWLLYILYVLWNINNVFNSMSGKNNIMLKKKGNRKRGRLYRDLSVLCQLTVV